MPLRIILAVALVLLSALTATAADPLSPEAAADRAAALVLANDVDTLTELARGADVDPWLVVDELCARDDHDTADRFSAATAEHVSAALARYAVAQRATPTPVSLRTALADALKLPLAERAEALLAIEPLGETVIDETVTSVRIWKELGDTLARTRRAAEAAPVLTDVADRCAALGWSRQEGAACDGLAWCAIRNRDLETAAKAYRRAASALDGARLPDRQADMLHEAGRVVNRLGDWPAARALLDDALAVQRSVDDRAGAAKTLTTIGNYLRTRGAYAESLTALEDAADAFIALNDAAPLTRDVAIESARCHHALSSVLLSVAQLNRAYTAGDVARALYAKHGANEQTASVLIDLATVRRRQNRDEESEALARAALELTSRPRTRASALMQLGGALRELERADEAVAAYREALALATEGRDAGLVSAIRLSLVDVALDTNDIDTARGEAEAALAVSRSRKDPYMVLEAKRALADVEIAAEAWSAAVEHAREAVRIAGSMATGLHGVEGARARLRHADLHDIGMRAALHLDSGVEAAWFHFAESGRATALVEEFGGRAVLQGAAVSPQLEAALEAATQAASVAAEAVAIASPRELETAEQQLETARNRVKALEARQHRRAAVVAGLQPTETPELETLQQALGSGEALVLYAVANGRVHALAASASEAWMTDLGDAEELAESVAALSLTDPAAMEPGTLDRLRAELITPLRATDHGVDVLLVSPADFLFGVPFPALAPDLRMGLVASGSTFMLLARQSGMTGTDILGLGGPEYGTGPAGETRSDLAPLPNAKAEVVAIADSVFVGAEASETALRRELGRANRWRAIHLACHGLLADDAMRSSLALSATDTDDGMVTAKELLSLDISADLLVLSACETGRGTNFSGEGLLGITRSCVVAGAPRVIASLWKVDDAATRALMEAFYKEWKPGGVGAAEALRRAQAHVRGRERWKAPRFWAGWVLWGLPQ